MKHAIATLDETGSLRGQQHRIVSSLNEYVEHLSKKTRPKVFKFDSERWTTFFCGKVKKWKPMKKKVEEISPFFSPNETKTVN